MRDSDSATVESLAEELSRLVDQPDDLRRRLFALSLVSAAFRPLGHELVLVGGAALEFYTRGGYATKDLDVALPTGPDVDAVFDALGFEKEGRYWFRGDLGLLIEAPAAPGVPDAVSTFTDLEIGNRRLRILGVGDVLLDRVRAALHWESDEDARWATRLSRLHREAIPWDALLAACNGADERVAIERLRTGLDLAGVSGEAGNE